MATEHLSPLDLAFWRIESAAHPMHLGALAVFHAAGPTAAAGPAGGAGPTAAAPGAAERAAALLAARCAA
ncbi:wax ester/triacylglycerol synthase domain-containing protein, partial [Streptomyces sp. NPDC057705]|uniref:wax ester/triacylglycerol synthase domain-containing protein n=1 Tax=Streptomyces sp. NPDC057705 TaxID=3346222 RepID=UPI0036B2D300